MIVVPSGDLKAGSAAAYGGEGCRIRRWLGKVPPREPDAEAWQLLRDAFVSEDATLLMGAPLKNPGMLLQQKPDVRIARWVAQGGFAGDSVVPPEHRLPKFERRRTCGTYSFNSAPEAALKLLESPHVGERVLVSKKVCHGVIYDSAMHAATPTTELDDPRLSQALARFSARLLTFWAIHPFRGRPR